jgi:hypothetical protein
MLQNPSQLIRSLPLQLEWQTRAVLRAPDQGFKLGQLKIYLKKILDSTNLEINQLFFGPKRTEASPSIDLLRTKLLMVCNSLSSGCWLQKQTTDISFSPLHCSPFLFTSFGKAVPLGESVVKPNWVPYQQSQEFRLGKVRILFRCYWLVQSPV